MSERQALGAFTRIREAAESHMNHLDELGHAWTEEAVTEASAHRGHPDVKVIKFTRAQEGKAIGADYLWWWLNKSSSVCFGMLVQAKRLGRDGERWKVDISYKNGKQLNDLFATAEDLEVPAMYGVYTGGRVFRTDLPCRHDNEPDCLTAGGWPSRSLAPTNSARPGQGVGKVVIFGVVSGDTPVMV